jgi:hypothetical protein
MLFHKKIKELYRFHETTRLLIQVQGDQVTKLLTRVHYLEEKVQYLHDQLEEAIDADL